VQKLPLKSENQIKTSNQTYPIPRKTSWNYWIQQKSHAIAKLSANIISTW